MGGVWRRSHKREQDEMKREKSKMKEEDHRKQQSHGYSVLRRQKLRYQGFYTNSKCHSFVNTRDRYSQSCKSSENIYF